MYFDVVGYISEEQLVARARGGDLEILRYCCPPHYSCTVLSKAQNDGDYRRLIFLLTLYIHVATGRRAETIGVTVHFEFKYNDHKRLVDHDGIL